MKPTMTRAAVRSASIVSLALWLALLGAWAASYRTPFLAYGRTYRFQSIDGVLRIDSRGGYAILRRAQLQRLQALEQYAALRRETGPDGPARVPAWMAQQIASNPASAVPARWAVRYAVLAIPFSALVVLCLLVEVSLRRRRIRLRRAGVCPGCGYDLRATPSRCPECGRATEVTTAKLAH